PPQHRTRFHKSPYIREHSTRLILRRRQDRNVPDFACHKPVLLKQRQVQTDRSRHPRLAATPTSKHPQLTHPTRRRIAVACDLVERRNVRVQTERGTQSAEPRLPTRQIAERRAKQTLVK